MSSTFIRRVEVLSNFAVILAAVAVCAAVVRQFRAAPSAGVAESFRGKTVNMRSITDTPAARNVVLALSQTCHFCEESMPFYHTLGEIRARANTHVYAVFPPAETESDKYLERHAVHTDGVVSARLDAVGVRGTPTLMVVDAKGKIERAWVGALNDAQKLEVLRTVEPGL